MRLVGSWRLRRRSVTALTRWMRLTETGSAELGAFAEDAEVPLPLITTLWQATSATGMSESDATTLCERLDGLSLVSLAWAGDKKVMVVHDVIRDFARSSLGPHRLTELNDELLAAVAAGLPAVKLPETSDGEPTVAWWGLVTGDGYMRGHLVWHLIEAGRKHEADALACDLRWAATRLADSGPAAVAADLALTGTHRATRMAAAVIRVAHLLARPSRQVRWWTFCTVGSPLIRTGGRRSPP